MRQQKYIKVEELPKTEDVEEFASFRNREIEKAVKQLEDCFTLPVVMRQQKYIKVEDLPKTEDVEEFASFRDREIEKAVNQLEDCFTLPVYRRCQNLVLALLASFNKRRPGILALKESDAARKKEAKDFIQIVNSNWVNCVSAPALSVMRQQEYTKVEELPKTEDVEEFASFRNKEIEKAVKQLEDFFLHSLCTRDART
ncbi:hypothetical protein HOLleu_03196 [Holothuria leucospilota]|uniref:Uncharacterized protein n=1 Tax=Holothuria leucospilota TaxID=206669 RepID=A0A9Q1CSQ0_HOLLE|nr:hypothetical protein HOLleu_03196 [Holothuria leucospilota]